MFKCITCNRWRSQRGADGATAPLETMTVDSVCSHLQDRFGPVQQKLFGLSALVPAHLGSYNDVVAGASLYESLISVH